MVSELPTLKVSRRINFRCNVHGAFHLRLANLPSIQVFCFSSCIVMYSNSMRYYSNRNRYWANRGICGPEIELFFGDLRSVWSYDNPRPLVLKEWTKQFGKVSSRKIEDPNTKHVFLLQVYGYLSGQRLFWVISDPTIISEIFVKRFDNFYAHAILIQTQIGRFFPHLQASLSISLLSLFQERSRRLFRNERNRE